MGSPDPHQLQGCANKDFFDSKLSPTTLFQRLPRGVHTRSLSEHGSQAPHRRWYLAHGPGRVGRRWIHGAPCLKGEGLLFLYTAPLRYALATTAGRYRLLVAHGPLPNRQGASSFFTDRSALMQAGARGRASLSPPRPVSTGRLRLTAPCRKCPRGLFFIRIPRPRHAELGSASASCARAVA